MSYVIRIYCRAVKHLTRQSIVEFIKDGSFFERKPDFEPDDVSELRSNNWGRLVVRYDPAKRPIIFQRDCQNSLVREEVTELLARLEDAKPPGSMIAEHVRRTWQVIAMEILREGLPGEAWEMIDAIEAHIASELEGLVYAPGDGVFDAGLKKILELD